MVFLVLSLYLDRVLPHQYGIRRNVCFPCFDPIRWLWKKARSGQVTPLYVLHPI